MYRNIVVGMGSVLIALGIAWFFTSFLDGAALKLAGATEREISPLSKMYLGDSLSLLFAGLAITGAGLVILSVMDSLDTDGRREEVAKE